MCMVDFEWELGYAYPFTEVYPSLEALKKARPCVHACGIVKVKVEVEEVVEQGVPFNESED